MAYPPAPGTSSLPARPPVSAAGNASFKPAFGSVTQPPTALPSLPSYASATPPPPPTLGVSSYPVSTAATRYGSSNSSSPAPASYLQHHHSRPSAVNSSSSSAYSNHGQHHHHQPYHSSHPHAQHQHQQQGYGSQGHGGQSAQYNAAPQIRNPFPTPGSGPADFDPEMAAQIAQWQSAYVPRGELDRDGRPTAAGPATEYPKAEMPDVAAQSEKKKTVVRQGGGKKWTDDSLMEWDPAHLRLFVGNLAGETTDESLIKAFSRWKSVQKARVIRDKRTTKSKGFGFVSFSDADDFFQAAKEMNGKYIQSHPVVVKKATTEIKVTNAKDKNRHGKKNNSNNQDNKKSQGGGGYDPYLGPMAGGGVTKPGQKTKNGLRLLG